MAGFWDKEQELLQVQKTGTKSSYYSFKKVEKSGKTFLDVREHFTRIDGSIQHTAKGMSIPMAMVADMKEGFDTVVAMLAE